MHPPSKRTFIVTNTLLFGSLLWLGMVLLTPNAVHAAWFTLGSWRSKILA